MVEEQQHGFAFQHWVTELAKQLRGENRPLQDDEGNYTAKWDLPASLNPNAKGGPVSIKTAKWNSSIGFGDARRQFQMDDTFTLIVGFWKQDGARKRVVKIVEVCIRREGWGRLWHPISLGDLESLDAQIKDRGRSYREAREIARQAVNSPPFSAAVFRANPKIDSKTQRRLQCSLTQENFFAHLAPGVTPETEQQPLLWGRPIPPFLPGQPRFGAA